MIRRRFRRPSGKKNFIIAIGLALMVSFVVMGGAYAIWDDVLFIRESGVTGNLDIVKESVRIEVVWEQIVTQNFVPAVVQTYKKNEDGSYKLDEHVNKIVCIVGKPEVPEIIEDALVSIDVCITVGNTGTVSLELVGGTVSVGNKSIKANGVWAPGTTQGIDPTRSRVIIINLRKQDLVNLGFTVEPNVNWQSAEAIFRLDFEQWNTTGRDGSGVIRGDGWERTLEFTHTLP